LNYGAKLANQLMERKDKILPLKRYFPLKIVGFEWWKLFNIVSINRKIVADEQQTDKL
jgi:hypothetical protein